MFFRGFELIAMEFANEMATIFPLRFEESGRYADSQKSTETRLEEMRGCGRARDAE